METIHFKKLALKRLNKFLDRESDIAEIAQNYAILVSEFDRIAARARAIVVTKLPKRVLSTGVVWAYLVLILGRFGVDWRRLLILMLSRGDGRRYIVESDGC